MIQEQYVSFETAKLLKEKGFCGECLSMYLTPKPHRGMGNPNEAKLAPHGRDSHYYEGYLYQCEAPTQQMAMRWLREVHNINIVVEPHSHNGFKAVEYEIMYWHEGHYHVPYQESHPTYHPLYGKTWNTYEEACEAAIRYCLEHLI